MELSSRWIGGGFALLALASITNLFALGTTIFHIGFRYGLEIFLYPVSALLTLTGWWLLTRYRPRDTSQNHSLRAGFLALALQFAALGLGEVFRANSVVFINWSSAQFWLASLGYVVTMIGFLMAVSCLRARVETPEVATTSTSPFSLLIFVGFALIAVSSLVILYHYVVNQFFTAMGWAQWWRSSPSRCRPSLRQWAGGFSATSGPEMRNSGHCSFSRTGPSDSRQRSWR
jgi:hypothetical protein